MYQIYYNNTFGKHGWTECYDFSLVLQNVCCFFLQFAEDVLILSVGEAVGQQESHSCVTSGLVLCFLNSFYILLILSNYIRTQLTHIRKLIFFPFLFTFSMADNSLPKEKLLSVGMCLQLLVFSACKSIHIASWLFYLISQSKVYEMQL